ncbi:MAG: glycoside hydrolase family 130 protein [Verrucomicrobiota bacterium]
MFQSPIVHRFPTNPLIHPSQVKPSHPGLEVLGAFNPGATLFEGKSLLFVRVAERPVQEKGYVSTAVMDEESGELKILRFRLDDPKLDFSDPRLIRYDGVGYVTSISHFRKAVSADGRVFTMDDAPTLAGSGPHETYGIEDARIVKLDGLYYISYTGVSKSGVLTLLASTRDFQSFEKLGIIFAPDNKDIAIFPERINGRYYTLHRPALKHLGAMAIWLASGENLLDWGHHRDLISPRPGRWDCERVGAGASPIKTSEGWLELYHGADNNIRYCTGALLLDLEEPWKVIARSGDPFLVPHGPCEETGFMPNVVFHNGFVDRGDGQLDLFYGGADEVSCGATVAIADILSTLKC